MPGSLRNIAPIVTLETLENSPIRNNQIALGQQQRTLNQQQIDQNARNMKLQRNLDAKLGRDATSLDHEVLQQFNSEIGTPPPTTVDSSGREIYDMAAIRNLMANKRALAFEAQGGFGTDKLTPFQEAAMTSAAKSGYLAAMFNSKTGQLKSESEMYDALLQMPRATPADSIAMQDSINGLNVVLQQIQNARARVSEDSVGPMSGNVAARKWAFVTAAFGGDSKQFQTQRDLERFINQQALEAAQKMKGSLSDNDIKFLKDSVIKLEDTPESWMKWLDEFEGKTRQALANRQAGIYYPEGSSTPVGPDGNPVSPASIAGSAPAAPSAQTGTAKDFSHLDKKARMVQGLPNSVAVRLKLERGTRNNEPVIVGPNGKKKVISEAAWKALKQLQVQNGI